MEWLTEDVIKIALAMLVGGLIGAEREYRDKAAGFRTIILICVGATLFTIFSLQIGANSNPTRIAANIVTGIGFLGAGTILQQRGRIAGLTTAAMIWLAAALGMGIGAGAYHLVGAASVAVLIVLWFFPTLERWIDNIRHVHIYEVTLSPEKAGKIEALDESLRAHSLRVVEHRRHKSADRIVCTWHAIGRPRNHDLWVAEVMRDPDIEALKY